jgi:hypothetical protein
VDPAAFAAGHGAAQPFLAPQPADPLVVDRLPVAAQQSVRHPPAPPRMLAGDAAQPAAQLLLLARGRPPREALGGAVLPNEVAGPPL